MAGAVAIRNACVVGQLVKRNRHLSGILERAVVSHHVDAKRISITLVMWCVKINRDGPACRIRELAVVNANAVMVAGIVYVCRISVGIEHVGAIVDEFGIRLSDPNTVRSGGTMRSPSVNDNAAIVRERGVVSDSNAPD